MARQAKDGSFPGSEKRTDNPYAKVGASTSQSGTFSWGDVEPELLSGAIEAVTRRGDAISFAVNRSGSAGSITVLAGPDRPRFFAETAQQAQELLVALKNAAR